MKMFGSARWMKRIQATAIASMVALSIPTAAILLGSGSAIAQTNATDQNFLNDLYSFLQSHDTLAYGIAAEGDPQSSIHLASNICFYIARDGGIRDLYDGFMLSLQNQIQGIDPLAYEEITYSAELYFGTVANLGSAYYCSAHNAEILDFLNTL